MELVSGLDGYGNEPQDWVFVRVIVTWAQWWYLWARNLDSGIIIIFLGLKVLAPPFFCRGELLDLSSCIQRLLLSAVPSS